MIYIRQALGEDYGSIIEIARTLHPQWFNEVALEQIAKDLQTKRA